MLSERLNSLHLILSYSLNPCFSGTCSRSSLKNDRGEMIMVLILVLVEHALGGRGLRFFGVCMVVLILVLVEHALGARHQPTSNATPLSLNPCFSGTCSRRVQHIPTRVMLWTRLNPCFSGTCSRSPFLRKNRSFNKVLILVLVEHALGDPAIYVNLESVGLNPCFSGTCSRRQQNGAL